MLLTCGSKALRHVAQGLNREKRMRKPSSWANIKLMSSIYNRAEIIDKNFTKFVKEGRLPEARKLNASPFVNMENAELKSSDLVEMFESQVASRHLDLRARELKNKNECFYTIGSSGHEGNAVQARALRHTDMSFLHYRSGAFMVERSRKLFGSTPLYDALLSFVASSEDPISGGRHKVFGSLPLLVPPQTSTIASHLPKAVGAAISITRARDLGIESLLPQDAVIFCSFGDASANHATAQSAFNAAALVAHQNLNCSIVFCCEDNGVGISVRTPQNWIETQFSNRPPIKYFQADGLNLIQSYHVTQEAVKYSRSHRKPVFLHSKVVRLLAHAGSDPEWTYHTLDHIEKTEFQDPLLHSARILIENSILTQNQILDLYESLRERVEAISEEVIRRPKLKIPEEVKASLTACQRTKIARPPGEDSLRSDFFGRDFGKLKEQPFHLAKLLNFALTDLLIQYPNALIFGEDVAQKGGVYNVTDGLHRRFGPRRVFNSPLDETSILGSAIGLAHNGFLPVPEIQFLAYVHNAEDQIRGEAATLPFFSNGQYTNPMVVRVPGLPYQKGFGGHFHNDNSLAIFRDIPGLIIAVPSNGADGAKMLRTCFRQAYELGRVVIFVEPIALYMTKDLHEDGDKGWSFLYPEPEEEIPLGQFGEYGDGKDLLIITYGNGYYYSRQAEKALKESYGLNIKIIDLRWVAPIDWKALTHVAKNYDSILIVDECRKTGSLSEGLVSGLVENLSGEGSSTQTGRMNLPKIKVLAGEDCFIPLGVAAAAGLPKKEDIIKAALSLKNNFVDTEIKGR